MAEITRRTDVEASLADSISGGYKTLPDLIAGETIAAGDAVFLHTDGKVYVTDFANSKKKFLGIAARKQYAYGEEAGITVLRLSQIAYSPETGGSKPTPGIQVYISATVKGGLADAAPEGGSPAVGVTLNDGVVFIY